MVLYWRKFGPNYSVPPSCLDGPQLEKRIDSRIASSPPCSSCNQKYEYDRYIYIYIKGHPLLSGCLPIKDRVSDFNVCSCYKQNRHDEQTSYQTRCISKHNRTHPHAFTYIQHHTHIPAHTHTRTHTHHTHTETVPTHKLFHFSMALWALASCYPCFCGRCTNLRLYAASRLCKTSTTAKWYTRQQVFTRSILQHHINHRDAQQNIIAAIFSHHVIQFTSKPFRCVQILVSFTK